MNIHDIVKATNEVAFGGLTMDIKFPKKKVVKEKQLKERIIICGTTSWTNKNSIKKVLKAIGPKTIEFVVLDTSRGASQLALSIAKELGIMVFQTHPWLSTSASSYVVQGKAMRLFKPTQIIAFNENPKENTSTVGYEKLARRANVDFKVVTK